VPADLFGAGAGQRGYSEAVPMRGDAGAVRGVSEEVVSADEKTGDLSPDSVRSEVEGVSNISVGREAFPSYNSRA